MSEQVKVTSRFSKHWSGFWVDESHMIDGEEWSRLRRKIKKKQENDMTTGSDWQRYIAAATPTYGPIFSERMGIEKEPEPMRPLTREENIKKLEEELKVAKEKQAEANKPKPIYRLSVSVKKLSSGYTIDRDYGEDEKAFSTKAQLIKEVTRMIEEME